MKTQTLIVAAGNALVALATYVYLGFNPVGGVAAARNTARFSSLVFAIALAAHFHRQYGAKYLTLIEAFVAGHMVHFGTVIVFHAIAGKLANAIFLGVAAGGSLLLAATALSATRAPKTHTALTYVIWLSFVIALSSRLNQHLLPEAVLISILVIAMAVHLKQAFTKPNASAVGRG